MPSYLTIGSGGIVSSASTLLRPYPLAISVPSVTASEVRLQFAQTSGAGGSGDFWADLQRTDGTGLPFSVYSGAGPALGYLTAVAPTPFVRLSLVTSQTNVRTFVLLEVTHYHS